VTTMPMANPEPEASSDAPLPTDPWPEIMLGRAGTRSDLVPVLQRAQAAFGYLSPDAVRHVARWLKITENEVYGVATFYSRFRFRPPGQYNIKVCLGTACHVGGGQNFVDVMKVAKKIEHGETSADGRFSLERAACLGCCALAPVVVVNEEVHGRMNRVSFMQLIETLDPSPEAILPEEAEDSPE
jgi:NADH-quinone oxidoreductase subunit E